MSMKSGIVWSFFLEKSQKLEEAKKQFEDVVTTFEALKAEGKEYNTSNYNFAKHKLEFYAALKKSLESGKINEGFIDEYRKVLGDLFVQEIIYKNDGLFCKEKLPKLMHKVVAEISQDAELQRIKYPFRDLDLRPVPDQEISGDKELCEKISAEYASLYSIKDIAEIQEKLVSIEDRFRQLL